jgi:hypothetical protein
MRNRIFHVRSNRLFVLPCTASKKKVGVEQIKSWMLDEMAYITSGEKDGIPRYPNGSIQVNILFKTPALANVTAHKRIFLEM